MQSWAQPLGKTGWAHPCKSLSQWHMAHCSRLSPAPFGVKQEQLSPRGQAGPPESLGVPTAQETSVLRGEAWGLPCGCHFGPWRVEAGMEHLIQNLLRSAGSTSSKSPSSQPPALRFRAGGPSVLIPRGGSRAWGLRKGHRHPFSPCVSHVFQGRPWARFQEEASARVSPATGRPPRAPSPTEVPSPM